MAKNLSLTDSLKELTLKLKALTKEVAKTEKAAKKSAAAKSEGTLPSGAVNLLREINQHVDRIERNLDDARSVASVSDREKTARFALEEAKTGMGTVEQRYGAKIAPDQPEVKACRDRLAAAEKQIEDFVARKGGEVAAASAAAAGAQTASADWVARLQPYVTPSYRQGYDKTKYLVPSATQDNGSSATLTGRPVSSRRCWSSPPIRAPPPVSTIP